MQGIGEEMNKQLENYVRGKFIELTLAGIATYILFSVFDLNYAALLAFLVGLSVIIPYLGIAVITVPVLVIALMQFGLRWVVLELDGRLHIDPGAGWHALGAPSIL